MWAELAAFLKANTTETLLITIVGTILVWMYKQFKDMIDREQQEKMENLKLRLALFTKLELAIMSTIHLNDEERKQQLFALLGECSPYLTTMQRTMVRDYYKQFDPTLLHVLQAVIVSEVDKLTRQLDKRMEYKNNGEWLNVINRLYAPVWPILLFGVVALYITIIWSLVNQEDPIWAKVNVLLFGFTVFVAITIVISAVYFLFKREIGRQGAKRWVAVTLFGFSPLLFFIRYDVSIIVLIIQAISMAYLSFSKRPPEIVRL